MASTRIRLTNPLALAVLTLLDERPMHPYEMSSTLRERHKEDSIKLNYGSLYSVVASLEKAGLIEARGTSREGNRPERTVYAITDAGLARMVDWMSELVSVPVKEYTQFEAALSLIGVLDPQEAIRLLERRLSTLVMQKHAADGMTTALPASFPRIFLIEGEFHAALRDAEITFIRDLVRDLRSGELSGFRVWQRMYELRTAGVPPEEIQARLIAEFPDEMRWMEDMAP